jgi:acyl-CoA reductase-like NAD-dependent aldehyde dehydrogenase
MSYCPADGRVLGNGIKPATVEDVNEAVRAAGAAQREWATSTFVERRKVLRTLLKYVGLNFSVLGAVARTPPGLVTTWGLC